MTSAADHVRLRILSKMNDEVLDRDVISSSRCDKMPHVSTVEITALGSVDIEEDESRRHSGGIRDC